MPEPSLSWSLLRVLWLPLKWILDRLRRRYRWLQPRLASPTRHRFFPPDLSIVVKLQMPRATVKAILGEPSYELNDRWTYQYMEACVQLVFRANGGSLETIIIGYTGNSLKDRVPIHWVGIPLGKLTLADALEGEPRGLDDVEFQDNLRNPSLVVRSRLGPPGLWQYLSFGAVQPLYGPLAPAEFKWDRSESRLVTKSSEVLINWVAISSSGYGNSWFDVSATVSPN